MNNDGNLTHLDREPAGLSGYVTPDEKAWVRSTGIVTFRLLYFAHVC